MLTQTATGNVFADIVLHFLLDSVFELEMQTRQVFKTLQTQKRWIRSENFRVLNFIDWSSENLVERFLQFDTEFAERH